MLKRVGIIFLIFLIYIAIWGSYPSGAESKTQKTIIIEDFDNYPPEFGSWAAWDAEPDEFELTDDYGYNDTSRCLHLWGNTAKFFEFYPAFVDSGDVWQTAARFESIGSVIGIGFYDSFHSLFYSLSGNECLDIDDWITCYQGVNNDNEWHEYNFPVADDWLARNGYLPRIKGIVFINSKAGDNGEVYFDEIRNMTRLLPKPPQVSINTELIEERTLANGSRDITVSFESEVIDEDSDSLFYYWQLGNGETVSDSCFEYTYNITDDHNYTVSLVVTDDTDMEGYACCEVELEDGNSSLPLELNFTGDVILARDIGTYINENGYEGLFDPTLEMLGNRSDLTIVNLECPLTSSNNHHPTKTIYFKGQPEYAEALTYAGVDIVTLANNHILDYMEEGIIDTRNALDEQGILYSGAGLNSYEAYRPAFCNRKGINLAFLAASDRTGQYNNYQPYLNAGYDKSGFAYLTKYYMQKGINEVRNVSDLVVMQLHCGSEYSTDPSSGYDNMYEGWYQDAFPEDEGYFWGLDIPQAWDIEYRHYAIDAGADAVICHHPHIIQGLESYNGKLIAHSLGNFMFDLSYTETMPTYVLYAEADKDNFNRWYIKPCYIDDNITKPATGQLGLYILDHIAHKSKELNGYLWVDRPNCKAEVILDTLVMPVYSHGFVKDATLVIRDSFYTTGPLPLERAGSFATLSSIDAGSNWQFRVGREIVYHGNYEDEGCSEWNINSDHEWLDEEEVYEGQYSLGMDCPSTASDNYITNLEGRIKLYGDADYTLHGMVKTENAGETEVQIRTYSSRTQGDYINMYGTSALSGDHDWMYVWQDVPELEDNANFIDFRTSIYPPDDGLGEAWFDNVGLIGWTEWHDFDGSPVEIESPNEYYYIEMRTPDAVDFIRWTYTEKNYGYLPVFERSGSYEGIQTATLHQNYPNPFNPETSFSFTLNTLAEKAEINIYNIKGQKVANLPVSIDHGTGNYAVEWKGKTQNGSNAASGVYFYRLMVDKKPAGAGKCVLLK